VYAIENDKVIGTYKVGGAPMVAKTNLEGNLLYVATSSYKAIEVFDTNTGKKIKEIKSGDDVTDFVISSDETRLVATNKDENSVSIIDLTSDKITKKVKALPAPKHISFNMDESKVYFTLSGTNKVGIIDMKLMKLVDEIKVGSTPHGIQLSYKSVDSK
jgi:YVTN family beta-propeller protein